MNDVELSELASCEKVIKRTRTSFVECGNALATIRDKRLYRATHKNFADYCADKWQLSRSHAYRMIDAAVQVSVSPMGDKPANERQARAQRDAARKPPVVVDEDTTEEEKTVARERVFAPDPPPGDVEGNPIQQPQDEPEPGSVGTALDENENSGGGVSVREGGDSVAAADTPPPDVVDGGAVSSPAPVDKPGRDTAVHRARPGKPAHRIPLNEAGATLYRAITTLETLVADKHNGADVIDYWIDQTGAHLDDIERQLTAAAKFIAHAQIVINQRKRNAA